MEAASDEIYFNKKLFRDLGITVPASFALTQDQFKDVVAKCAKGGYAAFATGAEYVVDGGLLLGPALRPEAA